MKKRTFKNLALRKKTISSLDKSSAIKGGLTGTTTLPSFFCPQEPIGSGSADVLCPSGPLQSKGCDSAKPSGMCPV